VIKDMNLRRSLLTLTLTLTAGIAISSDEISVELVHNVAPSGLIDIQPLQKGSRVGMSSKTVNKILTTGSARMNVSGTIFDFDESSISVRGEKKPSTSPAKPAHVDSGVSCAVNSNLMGGGRDPSAGISRPRVNKTDADATKDEKPAPEAGAGAAVDIPSDSGQLPAPRNLIATLSNATSISESARGIELVQAASAARDSVVMAANQDQGVLSSNYENLPLASFGERLSRARNQMENFARSLEAATDGSMDRGERARFRNLLFNAAGKAEAGIAAIGEEQARKQAFDDSSPFGSLFARSLAPSDKLKALGQFLGVEPNRTPAQTGGVADALSAPAASSNEGLMNRLLLLNGLPLAERAAAFRNMKLANTVTLQLPDGGRREIPLLHNGYIFGGDGSATDCSSFVSSILPTDIRKGRFTTLDFRTMWVYLRTESFPALPRYKPERAKLVRQVADGFRPINLHLGDRLAIGDLLVYRMPDVADGHVFIVKSYNHATLTAEVIEASQSAGTIRDRTFNLSVDHPDDPDRAIRPGIFALRLKPVNNTACSYDRSKTRRSGARSPSTDEPIGQGVAM
jgi:hypothetical protein